MARPNKEEAILRRVISTSGNSGMALVMPRLTKEDNAALAHQVLRPDVASFGFSPPVAERIVRDTSKQIVARPGINFRPDRTVRENEILHPCVSYRKSDWANNDGPVRKSTFRSPSQWIVLRPLQHSAYVVAASVDHLRRRVAIVHELFKQGGLAVIRSI